MKPYLCSVDIGGTDIKFGLFQTSGTLLHKWSIATRKQEKGAHLLPDIAREIQNVLAQQGISEEEVEGIGLGVPGTVSSGGFVEACPNLDRWGGFYAGEALASLCKIPVFVCNDANAAALGESKAGAGSGCQNVLFLTLGTGIGGGILMNGRLLIGAHGSAGEIGHIKVNQEETMPCGCGKTGCLEQYASATGIVNSAKKHLITKEAPSSMRSLSEISAKAVFDCAKAGDALACEVAEEAFRVLGKALANVSCVCDPEAIIIGGGLSHAGEMLTKGIAKYFAQYAYPKQEDTPILLASLGNDAGIYGLCHLVLSEKESL